MHYQILSFNHGVHPHDRHIWREPSELRPTQIGCDVWLGVGVSVFYGGTIGDHGVVGVGSGAVVTKDLPAGTISTGVPARVTGERHSRMQDSKP